MTCKHGKPTFAYCEECCREISQKVNPPVSIDLVAGYLVEWEDNDVFFKEREHAKWRADEINACGFKCVTVTPLYRQIAAEEDKTEDLNASGYPIKHVV